MRVGMGRHFVTRIESFGGTRNAELAFSVLKPEAQ